MEVVLSSGIVEKLCTRLESESGKVDVRPTLDALYKLCSGLKKVIALSSQPGESETSLTRNCHSALSQIEKAVITFSQSLKNDENIQILREKAGGIILSYFPWCIQLPSVRRELIERHEQMEAQREKEKREIEEVELNLSRKGCEEGRQQEEEQKKREADRKRKEEERRRQKMRREEEEERKREEEREREEEMKGKEEEKRQRNVKEGVAAIEVFRKKKHIPIGNVLVKTGSGWTTLLSSTFGPQVVRITFIIRSVKKYFFFTGLIAAALTEQAKTYDNVVGKLHGGAGWMLHPSLLSVYHDGKESHEGSACKTGAVGQRVVMEADGRDGKRTLKLSQDGETQPVFFSNIPVPFRFAIQMATSGDAVEIVFGLLSCVQSRWDCPVQCPVSYLGDERSDP
ncbi:hypothetical protein BLNAU_18071 [Blattamonas nauphoetae]|uniref:Uncharacterized protein n=1 Tax=Blattamonas nauphoetae TaxID=2049346 RepID=A0ABQ9X5F0_9EUKA|nr:hypothetical protein BLNAU_18071 [Blattamonas nauphoetae]